MIVGAAAADALVRLRAGAGTARRRDARRLPSPRPAAERSVAPGHESADLGGDGDPAGQSDASRATGRCRIVASDAA